jgi:hypothetical protein
MNKILENGNVIINGKFYTKEQFVEEYKQEFMCLLIEAFGRFRDNGFKLDIPESIQLETDKYLQQQIETTIKKPNKRKNRVK